MSPIDVVHKSLQSCPEWLRQKLTGLLHGNERVVLAFAGDMCLAGRYEPEALCVTDQRVLTLNEAVEEPVRNIELGQVAVVSLKRFMGNGILLVTTWHENIEVARFSATLSDVMEEFKDEFESYLVSRLAWSDPDENEAKVEHMDAEETTAEASQKNKRCRTCGGIIPEDREMCSACISKSTMVRRLLGYMVPHRKLAAVSLLLTVSVAMTGAVVPWLGRGLIDEAIMPKDFAMLRRLVLALACVFAVRAVVAGLRHYATARLSQEIVHDLRRSVYGHLQRLSLSYYDNQSTGRLISRVTSDTQRLQMFAVGGLQQFLVDLVLMAVVLCWMLSYSVSLTLLLWVPLPLLYVAVRWYHRRVHRVYRLTWRKMAGISAHLADTIPGIQVVKGFSQEERETERFSARIGSYKDEFLKAVVFSAKFSFCVLLLTQIGTLIAYWVGGSGAIAGAIAATGGAAAGSAPSAIGSLLGVHLTVGQLFMFMAWMSIMYMPVQRLSVLAEQFEQASTSAARVFEVLDTEPNIGANDAGPSLSEVREEIRFDNVSFNYQSGPPVLKSISFTVRAGETVGIVGPSGSGKTTLVKALCRFYDPTRGRILIDGHDLGALNLSAYRKMLGIVDQNPFLFGESILENIRYGRPDASPEEVIRAARTANAHEFIMRLPEGYDTQSQERGTRFSGGERQRICIARAVLKDPAILVLDEATSAVDTRNETLIQSALDRLIRGRTTFIIAHRLSTLRNADRILVVDKGELIDMAPHEVLLKRCKTYADLVKAQTELQKVTQEVA